MTVVVMAEKAKQDPREPGTGKQQELAEDVPADTASTWEALVDGTSGKIYYHDRSSGLTQWNKPPELA